MQTVAAELRWTLQRGFQQVRDPFGGVESFGRERFHTCVTDARAVPEQLRGPVRVVIEKKIEDGMLFVARLPGKMRFHDGQQTRAVGLFRINN